MAEISISLSSRSTSLRTAGPGPDHLRRLIYLSFDASAASLKTMHCASQGCAPLPESHCRRFGVRRRTGRRIPEIKQLGAGPGGCLSSRHFIGGAVCWWWQKGGAHSDRIMNDGITLFEQMNVAYTSRSHCSTRGGVHSEGFRPWRTPAIPTYCHRGGKWWTSCHLA
jgi:hypothetical protein